jgi:hypothetical protein
VLKDTALGILDRWDYSAAAVVLGAVMLGAALMLRSRATATAQVRCVRPRMVLWALVGAVAGALVAALVAFAANLLLLRSAGGAHAAHWHPRLIVEAAKTGGFLGCGLLPLVATIHGLRSVAIGRRRPGLVGP